MDEIYPLNIPIYVAKGTTIPEIVRSDNIYLLSKLVKRGPYQYPGVNCIIKNTKIYLINYQNMNKIKLEYGDIVHRYLMDNDIIRIKREIQGKCKINYFRINVLSEYDDTFFSLGLSIAITTKFNSDYNGDEINIFPCKELKNSDIYDDDFISSDQIVNI